MNKLSLCLIGGVASMGLCISCANQNSKDRQEDVPVIEFQTFHYDNIAQLTGIDTESESEGSAYCRVSGQGVLPLKIGKENVKQLADSLSKLAAIIMVNDKLTQPALDNDMVLTDKSPEDTEACSIVVNELSVDLVTPQLVVWKDYAYSYPCGAAHGMFATTYVNYSVKKGEILSLEDIFGKDYKERLVEMVRQKIKEQNLTLLVPLDEISVPEDFRLTTHSIEFIYSLYEIAPYSEGEVSVELSRYEIEDYFLPGIEEVIYGTNFD